MGGTPFASICCITYNHAPYIRQALDSFLMQRVDFPYEILVHDDASTDGTGEIVAEYGRRHPGVVKPLIQAENQYSKGIENISGAFNFPRVAGKYIFMCEGDDYWVEPTKMQRQVDYMEAHPGCALCFHSAKIQTVGRAFADAQMRPYRGDREITPEGIIDKPSGYAMCTMMFPSSLVRDIPDYYTDCPVGDTPLQWMAAAKGYGYYFDKPWGVYRVGVEGSWTNRSKEGDYAAKQRRYLEGLERSFRQFDAATGGRFASAVDSAIRRTYYQTMVNTKNFGEIMKAEYRRYYRELTPRTRFFLQMEMRSPGLYDVLRTLYRE
ncbi:MAG: glycosyltransferase [Lachnospiraceae bacterium]|jgi:glycosyltransferase involved in cell wall biosynthesis|nr:glycosyltransferase [Lachnospiraceae bacterium]